jgi:hypothetical protein
MAMMDSTERLTGVAFAYVRPKHPPQILTEEMEARLATKLREDEKSQTPLTPTPIKIVPRSETKTTFITPVKVPYIDLSKNGLSYLRKSTKIIPRPPSSHSEDRVVFKPYEERMPTSHPIVSYSNQQPEATAYSTATHIPAPTGPMFPTRAGEPLMPQAIP